MLRLALDPEVGVGAKRSARLCGVLGGANFELVSFSSFMGVIGTFVGALSLDFGGCIREDISLAVLSPNGRKMWHSDWTEDFIMYVIG